jgi:hypothetical protein
VSFFISFPKSRGKTHGKMRANEFFRRQKTRAALTLAALKGKPIKLCVIRQKKYKVHKDINLITL